MITAAHVRADVVDIRNQRVVIPRQLVLDANVLYWRFYTNFPDLSQARGRPATPDQIPRYLPFLLRAAQSRTAFHTTGATLGEFARTAESAHLEAIWRTDPASPQPDPTNPVREFSPRVHKFARFHYAIQLHSVRIKIQAMIAAILKAVSLLPQFPSASDQHTNTLDAWLASNSDFPDAALVAAAKDSHKSHLLSDDRDLATFPGVTLYTANQRTVTAARAAGRLL